MRSCRVQSQGLELRCQGSAVVTGGQGGCAPPNDCLSPPFWFTQNTFLEHHVTTRSQAMMEKGIITFKDNSRLKFSPFCKIASHQPLYIIVTQ